MSDSKITRSVIILTLSRLVVNMTRRFTYPFIPTISRQLNVPVSSVQSIIALQSSSGLISPIVGPWSDRFGAKRIAAQMVFLIAAAAFITAAIPKIWMFTLAMVIFGISKASFDPAAYAYLGNTVPYNKRGTMIGILELSWAVSLLIIAPLAGFLLSVSNDSSIIPLMVNLNHLPTLSFSGTLGLQLTLIILGSLSIVAYIAIQTGIPRAKSQSKNQNTLTPISALRAIRKSPAAMAVVFYNILLTIANEIFFINYGIFMEAQYGLALAALGSVTMVISLAEFSGEISVIGLADRFGKRRMALGGAFVSSIMYILLPLVTLSLPVTLLIIYLMFISVEISIVAALPLFTEVLPENRAAVMSSAMGGAALGRLLGAGMGGLLYATTQSFVLTGATASIIGLSCFFTMLLFIPEAAEAP